jgi:hypothetical protein
LCVLIVFAYILGSPRPDWQAISNTTCTVGAPVTFTAIAYPTPSFNEFKWYKEISNEWIPQQSSKDVQISVIGLETNLRIFNVTQANLGKYRLTVENSIGKYNQHYILIQKGKTLTCLYHRTISNCDFHEKYVFLQ